MSSHKIFLSGSEQKLGFRVREGTITGHRHTRKLMNNQDAHFRDIAEINGKRYLYGAVSDGCSLEGKVNVRGQRVRTEVGAVLLCSFIRSEIPALIASHTPLNLFPQNLYHRCISYLANISRTTTIGPPQRQWDFIERNLLATILGFVMDDQKLIVFGAGDGMVIVNDEINAIDQNNRPIYIAYHLLDREMLEKGVADSLPDCFNWSIYSTQETQRFAICTDGIEDMWKKDPKSINGIWDHEPNAPKGLQWWLKIGSNGNHFGDDCTIIAGDRISEEKGGELEYEGDS